MPASHADCHPHSAAFRRASRALEASGLSPRRLELEITETLLLEKVDHVLATLHALRALGVGISMDDFGTGYSLLSYLRSFPFDKIKIDRSFVRDLGSNSDARAIVRAIPLARIESRHHDHRRGRRNRGRTGVPQAEGCNEGQGYLFSKARPQPEILELLARQKPVLAA